MRHLQTNWQSGLSKKNLCRWSSVPLQRNFKRETRQYGSSLDAKLTITAKKRHVSTEPVGEKKIRDKYAIMTNMWLLAQTKQPSRCMYWDFDRCTLWISWKKCSTRKTSIFTKRSTALSSSYLCGATACRTNSRYVKEPADCVERKVRDQSGAVDHHRKHRTPYDPLASTHFDRKLTPSWRRLCSS